MSPGCKLEATAKRRALQAREPSVIDHNTGPFMTWSALTAQQHVKTNLRELLIVHNVPNRTLQTAKNGSSATTSRSREAATCVIMCLFQKIQCFCITIGRPHPSIQARLEVVEKLSFAQRHKRSPGEEKKRHAFRTTGKCSHSSINPH